MEGYLNYLKKEYEKTGATMHLKMSGWEELGNRIGLLEIPKRNMWLRNFAIGFAVLFILMTGTYQIALAALPGDPLYPVKILSERIVQTASGNNQVVIDHRAQEIIGLSKRQEVNSEDLHEVVSQYTQSVDQAKTDIKLQGKPSINFQNKLDEQHSEFERISRDHPDIQTEIKDARDASGGDDGHPGDD